MGVGERKPKRRRRPETLKPALSTLLSSGRWRRSPLCCGFGRFEAARAPQILRHPPRYAGSAPFEEPTQVRGSNIGKSLAVSEFWEGSRDVRPQNSFGRGSPFFLPRPGPSNSHSRSTVLAELSGCISVVYLSVIGLLSRYHRYVAEARDNQSDRSQS
jgi:hypothetical protein